MMSFNWVDIVIGIICARSIYVGVKRGISGEVLRFTSIAIGLVVAIAYYQSLADILTRNIHIPVRYAQIICFIILYAGIFLVFRLFSFIFSKVSRYEVIGTFDRLGGAVIGIARSLILSSLILIILLLIPSNYIRDSVIDNSFSGEFFVKSGLHFYGFVSRIFPEAREIDIEKFIK